MKKILIIFIALIGIGLLLTQVIYSFNYVLIRDVRGGKVGVDGNICYDRVLTKDGIFTDIIQSSGVGVNTSPTVLSVEHNPTKENMLEKAVNYALDQIVSGKLNGRKNLSSGLTVKWSAENSNGATSLIKVWSSNKAEPKYIK